MIKYIDPFLEENTSSFCDFFERLDKKMLVSLTNCKEYIRLTKECEKIKLQYPNLVEIIESAEATNDIYTKEEIQALATYIYNQHKISNYEIYEMYKIVSAECLQWLMITNLL